MLKPKTFIKTIRILIIFVFWRMVQNGIPRVSQSYFKILIFSQPGLGKTVAKNWAHPRRPRPAVHRLFSPTFRLSEKGEFKCRPLLYSGRESGNVFKVMWKRWLAGLLQRGQILSPWLRDIIDYGISYRLAGLHKSAGRYDNTMP